MVRTARSLEEEARVRLSYGPGIDRFLSEPELYALLETRTLEKVLEYAREGTRRVLVVGLEDRGNVALALSKDGKFVTVVDPDEALLDEVRRKAEEERCALRMNFYASDYMQRHFASSGFDMVVFFSSLQRFNEPAVVVRKATRELRVSGRFFARVLGWPRLVGSRLGGERVSEKVKTAVKRLSGLPVVSNLSRLPSIDGLLDEVAKVLKIERVEPEHIVTPFLAYASLGLPYSLRSAATRLLSSLSTLEDRLLASRVAEATSPYVCIFASKELNLGKTFRPRG